MFRVFYSPIGIGSTVHYTKTSHVLILCLTKLNNLKKTKIVFKCNQFNNQGFRGGGSK